MTGKAMRTITYQEALDALAICEVETVSESQRLDPRNENADLMAKTAAMIDAIETYVGLLFDVDRETLREDVGRTDPKIIKSYMDKRAMRHMESRGRDMFGL